jgi:hypothetical protein
MKKMGLSAVKVSVVAMVMFGMTSLVHAKEEVVTPLHCSVMPDGTTQLCCSYIAGDIRCHMA